MSYTLKIYSKTSDLPESWNTIVGNHNIMLSKEYFYVLETSGPRNMECFFVGFFMNEELIGGALFQYLSFIRHKTFQKNEVWCNVRNFTARQFSKDVMILGNNMLTGQNGFYFDASKITVEKVIPLLDEAVIKMQKEIRKTSLVIYKDYQSNFVQFFQDKKHKSYFRFSVQPTMMLKLRDNWKTFEDYLNDFSTKYRSRVKSARKRLTEVKKHELDLDEIKKHQQEINFLYQNVAENAPFNTFFLAENHFENMKENLREKFKVFGYFSEEKLVGFYTLILNNEDIDTYFLGYNKEIQKEKQLYLNMLLDMVGFSIDHRFKRVIFGRTALEIKSTIGAEPVEIFGLIKHNNFLLNQFIEKIFTSVTPKTEWIQRKPFK
ncbi:Peptidogalycan biosysnthesis/recognition [Chryseobacterium arachidis]|uniref:Peptidogalycan biosysnthesis/recognition n=1 Tax=Chryseobacterium arachidis TaxID=1416778 RepID=A0A1M4ZNS1_9FLAO|nr:peptidogalycan biosysnthesis protein [Chryseobacterium arachidis]SHF19457.1 Peptidogalycan biosysnthesis/recognition [Chryseobacterium arachidis]